MALLKGEPPVVVTETCVAKTCVRLFAVSVFCSRLVEPTARVVEGLEVDLEAVVRPVKKLSVNCEIQEIYTTLTTSNCLCGWRKIDRAGIPCWARTNFSVGTTSNDPIACENTKGPVATSRYTPDQLKLGGCKELTKEHSSYRLRNF